MFRCLQCVISMAVSCYLLAFTFHGWPVFTLRLFARNNPLVALFSMSFYLSCQLIYMSEKVFFFSFAVARISPTPSSPSKTPFRPSIPHNWKVTVCRLSLVCIAIIAHPHLANALPVWSWELDRLYIPPCTCQITASLALWLRRPPRERKVPGSNPACAGIFSGSYQWLKNWHSSGYPAERLAL